MNITLRWFLISLSALGIAPTAFGLTNNCPSPQGSCAASCGTFCTYWTCADPSTTPSYSVTKLPQTVQYETPGCTNKITDVVFDHMPMSYPGGTLTSIPTTVALTSWACLSHSTYGGACSWSVSGWSGCDASCGYGTQTRSVTCPAPDGNCSGTAPASSQSCYAGDCSAPPDPTPTATSTPTTTPCVAWTDNITFPMCSHGVGVQHTSTCPSGNCCGSPTNSLWCPP